MQPLPAHVEYAARGCRLAPYRLDEFLRFGARNEYALAHDHVEPAKLRPPRYVLHGAPCRYVGLYRVYVVKRCIPVGMYQYFAQGYAALVAEDDTGYLPRLVDTVQRFGCGRQSVHYVASRCHFGSLCISHRSASAMAAAASITTAARLAMQAS